MGLTNALTEVLEGLNDERCRTRAGFYTDSCKTPPANLNLGPQGRNSWGMRNPDTPNFNSEKGDLGSIWRTLAALKDISNELIRNLQYYSVQCSS
jgi:hypothetical protein